MAKANGKYPSEAEAKVVGARLRDVRVAHGKSQREFAALIDVTESNWSEFENGKKRLSLNAALRLATGPLNISLDWIYLGRSARQRAAIAEAVKAEQAKRKPGRPKGSKNKPKTLEGKVAEAVKAEQPKRKPGRPKGGKNKPKSKPPIDPYGFL
jgi:transcriptional regulator with XRE-family HTH domain